jgi:UDP-N-acetylenolpyruvoylglucosamine reductase
METLSFGQHSVGGLIHAASAGIVDLGNTLDWIELRRPGARGERWSATDAEPAPTMEDLERRVVTRVRFCLRPSGLAEISPRTGISTRRRSVRSTGPVFLDARDATAADLLAEAGCSGMAVGGVRLGGLEVNELIAGRSATSTDVIDLCRRSRDRVLASTGVELETALAFIDEDGSEVSL